MELYGRYKERWLQIELNYKGIYIRCRKKDRTIEPYKPFFISEENNINLSFILEHLLILTQVKIIIIIRAYIYIQVKRARGHQYFYKKYVISFSQNVTKIFNILPFFFKKFDIIIIRFLNTENNDRIRHQFIKDIKVRKSCIKIQLDFLKENYPDYRHITVDEQRIDILSINDNIDLRLIYIELIKLVIDARPNTLFNTEYIQEDFKRLPVQLFVLNLILIVIEIEILRNALKRGRQYFLIPFFLTTPINIFYGTQRVFAILFPYLFLFSKADFYFPRVRSVILKEYIRHLITY